MDEAKERSYKLSPLVIDHNGKNDYAAWAVKAKSNFERWKLWEHVGGSKTQAPIIPKLVQTTQTKRKDINGNDVITVVVLPKFSSVRFRSKKS